MSKVITTNCFILESSKLLLGMKKRGFGAGRWNGFGGKLEVGESLENNAKREVIEECGISVKSLELFGVAEFSFIDGSPTIECNFFKVTEFEGSPVETEEMKPQWFELDKIPFEQMWPDDKYWMPLFLAGKKFKAKFLFEGHDIIVSKEITEVESL